MANSVAFLAGLLDGSDPVGVGADDFAGVHGPALREWQRLGLLSREPSAHPAPGCPCCGEGVPYEVRGRYICDRCGSRVNGAELHLWSIDRRAFLL
jgi:hypothetical protein